MGLEESPSAIGPYAERNPPTAFPAKAGGAGKSASPLAGDLGRGSAGRSEAAGVLGRRITYDAEAEVLYINFRRPSHADDSELTDDDVLVRYQDGEAIGITVLHASRRGDEQYMGNRTTSEPPGETHD